MFTSPVMLTKIDWYILKKLIITFIFCMLLFTVIAVAVDSSEHTDDFVKSGLTTSQIIEQYYVGFIPWIWGMLYPLSVFIAVIFFTSKMALRSEVIAIIASGTTYNRWLRPYIIGGIILATGLWFANAYGIPKANELKANFISKYVDNYKGSDEAHLRCENCFYKRIDSNSYIGIQNYIATKKSAGPFFLNKVKDNKLYYNLRASRIEWDTTKRMWKLTNIVERTLDSMKESLTVTPSRYIDLNLKPEELRKDDFLKDKLTTPELASFIETEELRATEGLESLKVEKHRRTASSITVILLTIIGAVLAGRRSRGGSGLHLAMGIVIAAVFMLSDRFSTVFAVKGDLPPVLAAWLPNIMFSMVALILYRKAPK